MARARSGGPGMYVWALVFFSFSFVIVLILAILFYTRIEAADSSAKKAIDDLSKYASSAERSNPVIAALLANGAGPSGGSATVVGQLQEQNARLKQIVKGDTQAELADITNVMKVENVSEGNLLRFIKTFRENLESEKQLVAQLNENYKTANERREAVEAARKQLDEEYKNSVALLRRELDTIRGGMREHQTQLQAQATKFETQLKDLRDEHQQKVIEFESTIAQKDQQIVRLTQRINELLRDLEGRSNTAAVDPSTLADGHVVSILGDQEMVYIDRGRRDRIIRGMTFEVFDRKTGVVKDQFDEYRGKATIEVIAVEENASKARIVRRGKTAVLQDDVIANVVYDPDMIFKFFVYGEFDIDYIGQATQTDRRRIEAMVLEWGAQLVASQIPGGAPAELSYDVDFLVLGKEPSLPEKPGEDVIDPVVLEAYDGAQKRYDRYHQLVNAANELSIPILNQNRFLTMIGYYRR